MNPVIKNLAALLAALIGLLGASNTASAAITFTGPVKNIDGRAATHVQFPKREEAVNFRPGSATDKKLTIENYWIHDLTNQKGLDIRATRRDNGLPAWAYETITIRNTRITNVERREDLPGGAGLHIDHIRIAGGDNNQDVKMNVLIENVEIDGGDALPILFTDGMYGTVTLRNVTIKNTSLNNVQFKTDKCGSVGKIIVDNCPGIGVALIGRPGSVGEVLVRNSPGIRLGDSLNSTGRTGATISYIDAVSGSSNSSVSNFGMTFMQTNGSGVPSVATFAEPAPVPEPSALGLLGLVGLLARRRAR